MPRCSQRATRALNTRAAPPNTGGDVPSVTSRLLPLATQAGAAHRRAAAAAATVMLLALAATLVATPFGRRTVSGSGSSPRPGCSAAVALAALRARRRGEDRGAWIALTVALAAWSFGNIAFGVLYAGGEPPEGATLADAGWVAFYPAAYLCIGLHLRARVRGLSREHVARRPRRRAGALGGRHRAGRRADPRRLAATPRRWSSTAAT